jgi:hypothetical protein
MSSLISNTKKHPRELFTLLICSVPLPPDNQKPSGSLPTRGCSSIALLCAFAIILFTLQSVHAQDTKSAPSSPHILGGGIELPVTLRQNVTAGNTPAGTKIQARLTIATLVNGVVIPEGAVLTGEVTESSAKTKDNPSRLSIRLDSAQWKAHPEPLQLSPTPYLTEWFYPPIPLKLHDHDRASESGFPDASHNPGFGSGGAYPGQRNPAGPPFSSPSSADDPSRPDPSSRQPQSDNSQHREQMKSVEVSHSADGIPALSSKTLNIKLDKNTTYVFASDAVAAPSTPTH